MLTGCVAAPTVHDAVRDGADAARTIVRVPFASDSPFNLAIPEEPVVDPQSDAMVRYLARKEALNAGLFEFAIPIWEADARTPRAPIRCSMDPAWGNCPFAFEPVPMPQGAEPHQGSDGALVVLDWSAGKSYEFWQLRRQGSGWLTSWGSIQELRGSGFGQQGSSTAAGASRLAGVIRVHEIEAGHIGHALALSIDNACTGIFRAPASKTDGDSSRADCTPEGARLQLDPSIDLSSLPALTEGERTVGQALQEYGAYVIDKGGAPMAVSFELARDARSATAVGSVYTSAGLRWDYYDMPHLPWERLRVLRQWQGH